MASQLPAILAAIAGLSVTVPASIAYNGDKTPQVLYLTTLPQTAADAKLPARLIRMFDEESGGATSFAIVFNNASIATLNWRIYDVLLWRKIQQGLGLASHEADLTKYVAAYVVALQAIPALTNYGTTLKAAQAIIQEINYPAGSDYYFAGVKLAIDVQENLRDTGVTNWG